MTNSSLTLIAIAVLGCSLCALAAFCIHALRRTIPQRLGRLEDALRVYNAANAALGRQLVELDAALAQLRAQPGLAASGGVAQTSAYTAAAAAAPITAPSAAQRYGLQAAPESAPEFSEAELRLAQLIKARLSTLRLN